jgi:hypothetical protein
MSYNYQAKVIYGFPLAKYPDMEWLGKDAKGYQVYLDDWLENKGLRPVADICAGPANGGTPDHLVGIVVCSVDDFTRALSHTSLTLPETVKGSDKVVRAARLLGAKAEDIGFHLIGVRG